MYLNLTITSDLLSILCVMKDVVELSRNFQIKSFLLQKMNFLKKFSDLDTKTGKLADDVKQKWVKNCNRKLDCIFNKN